MTAAGGLALAAGCSAVAGGPAVLLAGCSAVAGGAAVLLAGCSAVAGGAAVLLAGCSSVAGGPARAAGLGLPRGAGDVFVPGGSSGFMFIAENNII